MAIEVVITKHELISAGTQDESSPRATEQYIIERLRKAGVPICGTTFFLGVEYGTLTMRVQPDFDNWKFTWRQS